MFTVKTETTGTGWTTADLPHGRRLPQVSNPPHGRPGLPRVSSLPHGRPGPPQGNNHLPGKPDLPRDSSLPQEKPDLPRDRPDLPQARPGLLRGNNPLPDPPVLQQDPATSIGIIIPGVKGRSVPNNTIKASLSTSQDHPPDRLLPQDRLPLPGQHQVVREVVPGGGRRYQV